MPQTLWCWHCGASLAELTLPFRRLETCPACEAELHVCRMCRFYDPRLTERCSEQMAEEVRDKTRANFCDYFKPSAEAYVAADDTQSVTARASLEELFGSTPEQDRPAERDAGDRDSARARLERLFDD